jgi:hypothetical protein
MMKALGGRVARRAQILCVILPLSLVVGCGGEQSAPSGSVSPEPSGFSTGEAHVEITGDLEATIDLTLAKDREASYEDGNVSVSWEDGEGNFMSIAATPKDGEADARTDEAPLLATFVVEERSFTSEATRTCAATFDKLTTEAVSGTLTCSKLRLPEAEAFRSVDVEATFSASG